MNWLATRASWRSAATARRAAAWARMGVDARAVVRGLRRAGPRLGAAPRAAWREARGAAGADVVRQGRRPDRLEPDAGLLPVGAGQRPLGQPARPRARGHRRAGRGVRAGGARSCASGCSPTATRAAGEPVVDAVHRREDIYHGPHADERTRPAGRDRPDRVHGRGARAALADAGRARARGAHRQPCARRHPDAARTRRAPRARAPARGDRGRRADGALPPRPAGRRRHGRPRAHRGAAPGDVWQRSRSRWRHAVRAARERLPLLGRRREAHPGHARRARATYEAAGGRVLSARHRAGRAPRRGRR